MLVRSGVEHDLGPVLLERPEHPLPLPDVDEQRAVRGGERGGDVVQVGLVVVEQQQSRRIELGDLPGDLRADRAAGPRDEHPAPTEQLADRAEVGDDLLAAQQVVDAHLPDVLQAQSGPDDLVDRRGHPKGYPRLLGGCGDALDQLAGGCGHREQHLVRLLTGDRLSQVGGAATHRDAEDLLAVLAGVVVEEAHRDESAAASGQHLPGQSGPGLAGTDDDDAKAAVVLLHPTAGEQPRLEAHGPHQRGGQRRGGEDRAWAELAMRDQGGHAQHRHGHQAGLHQSHGLVDARVPPHVAVDAEEPAHPQEDGDDDGEEAHGLAPGIRLGRPAVADQQDRHQRQRNQGRVQQHHQQVAAHPVRPHRKGRDQPTTVSIDVSHRVPCFTCQSHPSSTGWCSPPGCPKSRQVGTSWPPGGWNETPSVRQEPFGRISVPVQSIG